MTEDQMVAQLRRAWGLDGPRLVGVPYKTLLQLVGLSAKTVGQLQVLGSFMGESGRFARMEADRAERTLNQYLDEIAK